MNDYRYILEPYQGMNTRHTCPSCNKRNVFTFYIDSQTGEHLPDQYGRCERSDKCGYHLNPYKDGYSQRIWEQERGEYTNGTKHKRRKWHEPQTKPQPPEKPVSYIPLELLKQSLKAYEQNNFVKYLIGLFGTEIAGKLVSKYFIGTSKHWPGATIFWQIDIQGTVRSGKIMLYSPTTGKRVKQPFNHIDWVHSALKQPEFELKQCFFGEHLLKGNTRPVAVVESEKTATVASVYFPQFVWIAAGNLNGMNAEKSEVLRGRQVVLYPDLSKPKPGKPTAFEVWSRKAQELATIANFTVNNLLERKAGEAQRIEGSDLVDYLIKFDYKKFIEPDPQQIPVLELDDICHIQWVNYTGKRFENLILAWMKTKEGRNYELIFNKDEHPLPYGEKTETVKRLAQYFNKLFKPIQFENGVYYSHIFLN